MIHDQCLNLITLQAPVARDARLVTGVLDAIVDLELIGDYAYEMVASLRPGKPACPRMLSQIADIGAKIQEVLLAAVDCWRNENRGPYSPRAREAGIRGDCHTLGEKISQLTWLRAT